MDGSAHLIRQIFINVIITEHVSVWTFIRDYVLCADRCSLHGHTVSEDVIGRLGEKWTETTCVHCGAPLIASINPNNPDRYIWRATA